jgi:CheY-like chemotaxis protein
MNPVDRPPAVAYDQPATTRLTVLVAEDEAAVRKFVRTVLTARGYSVLDAGDGAEALRLCCQHPEIDLLVTDIVMPVMDGRELARSAAALRPNLRVLFMSGYNSNAVLHRDVPLSEAPFLQKPFTPGVLAEKVRAVLAGA